MLSGENRILAFDIGATSSKGLLCKISGEDIAVGESDGFNLRTGSRDQLKQLVLKVTSQINKQVGTAISDPFAVVLGIAGGGSKESRQRVADYVQSKWIRSRIFIHHDAFIAHYGAFRGGPGVMVTSGTGSIAYGRNSDGTEARGGGWGWMLGDEGSGWWIGRQAVRSVLSAREGGQETKLTELVKENFEINEPYELLGIVYAAKFDRSKISSLSKQVYEIALAGDAVAASILHNAGKELGLTAIKVAAQLGILPKDLFVAVMGSVGYGAGDLIRNGVNDILVTYADLRMKKGTLSPEELERHNGQDSLVELKRLPVPNYPPSDLTIKSAVGPACIEPEMDALHGAALWASDTILKRGFA
ncbi:BadF/BadG/BcrA/BcrD ATPase family protein [Calditrichota bacterium]